METTKGWCASSLNIVIHLFIPRWQGIIINKVFHFQVKEKHQPIFPANDIIITSVINFLKNVADVSNLPWIARQVFRSENVDLAEITEKLRKAVEHYTSLSKEESAPQSPGIAPGNNSYKTFKILWGPGNNFIVYFHRERYHSINPRALVAGIRAGHRANWPAVRTILTSWFDNLKESFSYKEVLLKMFWPPLKTCYPWVENINGTPWVWLFTVFRM